jgi:NAD(P)-dependent dehydrogenase (short-subunit alcohol dehydrogenase family)
MLKEAKMNHPENKRDFQGRTVMITGAAGNLGKAVAQAFARQGARLVLVDRATQRLHEQFGEGGPCLLVPADLLDGEAVAAAVGEVLRQTGRIDALCNLAGGFSMGHRVHETSDAELDALFNINVRTMLNAVRAVVPSMLEAGAGKIVNVGAMSALRGSALMGSYCVSKDAVIRLTESMAAELGSRRPCRAAIPVNGWGRTRWPMSSCSWRRSARAQYMAPPSPLPRPAEKKQGTPQRNAVHLSNKQHVVPAKAGTHAELAEPAANIADESHIQHGFPPARERRFIS